MAKETKPTTKRPNRVKLWCDESGQPYRIDIMHMTGESPRLEYHEDEQVERVDRVSGPAPAMEYHEDEQVEEAEEALWCDENGKPYRIDRMHLHTDCEPPRMEYYEQDEQEKGLKDFFSTSTDI